MSSRGEKRTARMVQELTGRSYSGALRIVREWTAAGLRWEDEMIRLAKEPAPTGGAR